MSYDSRQFNGGFREGSGRPKTVSGWHQIAVRLPKDMVLWVWRQPGSAAEVLRRLIRQEMEQEAAQLKSTAIAPPKADPEEKDSEALAWTRRPSPKSPGTPPATCALR